VDIGAWLRSLGLERYEQAFREHEVDLDVLPRLTAKDLKEIGVVPIGHRRRLLEAIAALSHETRSATAQAAADAGRPLRRSTEADRRQLTIMFCDLVGSTELARRLDPEDVREIMRAYHGAVAGEVTRFGGHVARYMGDGVLAYFGYPKAHEDQAERAVRAGLATAAAVKQITLPDGTPLRARVGIATGLVVVGDLVGEGAAREHEVTGETPNLAARLQAIAEPDAVVVESGCQRVVGGLFEYADLGRRELKGFTEPIQVWQVLGETEAENRFEALHGRQLTPLVGRDQELGVLLDGWARARRGEGQVVLLAGEPGIGKSRIVRALRERLSGQASLALQHYCSPHHTSTPLHPVIGHLERAAGFARDDGTEARLAKLEAVLARGTAAPGEALPLVAALLGLAPDARYPAPALSPQRQKQRTLEVLVDQVQGLAARAPLFVVFEDVHWSDPTTLELLDLLIERVAHLPVLMLITFRSEFSPPWPDRARMTQLSLARLSRHDGRALVAQVAAGKPLPDEVLDQILARTDGVPLFVEELTKAVLESDLLADAGDRYALAGRPAPPAIPATLRDSLMARLDRMEAAKRVAQIGAVLGHRFDPDLIGLIWNENQDILSAGLAQLTHASLLLVHETSPKRLFEFRHTLIGDIAYDSLLRQERREYHARAAAMLDRYFPAIVDEQPEVIARHYAGAGQSLAAFDAWLKAGRIAARRSANKEAMSYFSMAEDELSRAGAAQSDVLARRRLELLVSRASVLVALRGWSANEVEGNYVEALRIADQRDETYEHRFDIWRGLFNVYVLRGNLEQAEDAAGRLRDIALGSGDQDLLLSWHRAIGLCAFLGARFDDATQHMAQAMASFDPAKHPRHTFAQGAHPAVIAHSIGAWAHWLRGDFAAAAQTSAAALDAAKSAEHPFSLAYALCLAASLAQCRDLADEALKLADSGLALSTAHEFPYWQAWASIIKGWALAARGDAAAGVEVLKSGIGQYEATGAAQIKSYALCLLAEAYARTGRWREVVETAEAAITQTRRSGIVFYAPEAHRLRGEALCRTGESMSGVRALVRAFRLAQRQRSAPLLLRAAASLLRRLDRDPLRAIIAARAERTLAVMAQTCSPSELAGMRDALARARAGSI